MKAAKVMLVGIALAFLTSCATPVTHSPTPQPTVADAPPETPWPSPWSDDIPQSSGSVSASSTDSDQFSPNDGPTATTYPNTWTFLTNIGYVSAYDETFKNPAWVAYRLTGTPGTPARRPSSGYPTDNRTQSKLSATDYPSGYDHGHMAPNNAIATFYGDAAQAETFLMTNMLPQRHGLNAGPWKTVESAEIKWERARHTVWVFCGPVYTTAAGQPINPSVRFGPKAVCIPSHCFKIVITKDGHGKFEALAFIMPQENASGRKPKEFLTSIREIERRTGLNFFAWMTQAEQDEIEEEAALDLWATN